MEPMLLSDIICNASTTIMLGNAVTKIWCFLCSILATVLMALLILINEEIGCDDLLS